MNPWNRFLRDSVPLLGYACLLGALFYAWKNKDMSIFKAALIAFFAGLAVWFFTRFADSIQIDGAPHIESHWGGLGGGVGGWRISTSLVYLAGAIAFGVILLLIIEPPRQVPESKTTGKDLQSEKKSAGDAEESEPADSEKNAGDLKSKDGKETAAKKDSTPKKDAAPKKDSATNKKPAASVPPSK